VSASDARSAAPVNLDQFIALNDEIAALVRVGVPLEHGLAQIALELPGRTGRTAGLVAACLQRGQSLEQILAEHPEAFPPVYRAVIRTGLASGRLASALESIAASARHLDMTRRMIAASLLYPILVVLLAWAVFVFYAVALAPGMCWLLEDFGVHREVFNVLERMGHWAVYWGPSVPVIVVGGFALWWTASGRASRAEPGAAARLLGWLPWTRRMFRTAQVATFADLLALLVEHSVPLPEGVVLAAEATGGRRLGEAAGKIAEALKRGEPLGRRLPGMEWLPPMLVWSMSFGQARDALLPALRQAAEMYRQRAADQAEVARIFVPVFLTVFLAGSVVLLSALLVLGNWFSILRALA
jgi:type II secretory pathway component PulF